MRRTVLFLLLAAILVPPAAVWPAAVELVEGFSSYSDFPKAASWEKNAPAVRTVTIKSSADGSEQRALYYDSGSPAAKPLLLALHSWSYDYTQPASIPYGIWAVQNDWVFIHPDYRGRYNRPEATASELAIRDILDALAYAKANARIDPARIYLAGFSGGAMTALVLAGRYPEQWTAVSAWVPIFSLKDWYAYNRRVHPERHYAGDIAAACGGQPQAGSPAAAECEKRSPSSHLAGARGKAVQIQLACGIRDDVVPPTHSLRAFNVLAREGDRLSAAQIEHIGQKNELPPGLHSDHADPLYEEAGAPLLLERTSGNVTLVLFAGGHDLLFNPALHWLSRQQSPAKP